MRGQACVAALCSYYPLLGREYFDAFILESYYCSLVEEFVLEFIPQIQKIRFRSLDCHVWRDDLHELIPGVRALCGNKARKLYFYLNNRFPDISALVSYGSVQSNMLLSLSVLAKIKGWTFEYYVDHIPKSLVDNPRGNFACALGNGALIREFRGEHLQTWVEDYVCNKPEVLYIPEGGRHAQSEPGILLLAEQIDKWAISEKLDNPKLVLPSGTGTTACYLQKHLPFEVLTCACVGNSDYLRAQFSELEPDVKRQPSVITANRKYHFGKLYPEFLEVWQQLKATTGIEFDLLYDPPGWICMLEYRKQNPNAELIYLHQGGQLGNPTMLERYHRQATHSQ